MDWLRARRCKRKRAFPTWDAAEAECLLIAREGKPRADANPPTPYRCDQPGDAHYHIGHMRFGRRESRTTP